MLNSSHQPAARATSVAHGHSSADYGHVRRAIEFLTEHWTSHPSLDDLAAVLGLNPTQTQKLFTRWCGLSPKDFIQAITLDHARSLLAGAATVLETAHEVGLSGGGRLHDLFVTHEAMSPGEYKRRGEGLTIRYGFCGSPFGETLLMTTPRGLCGLAFVNDDAGEAKENALADMMRRWPKAIYIEDGKAIIPFAQKIFPMPPGAATASLAAPAPVRLVLIGSDFEVRVWQTLLRIPMGRAVSYRDIAEHLGSPTASRAVGSAVGRNPISFVVPCHRVLRGDGTLGGYHWGLTRKRALIGWETGRTATTMPAARLSSPVGA